jgi:Family of unknown function (DUF6325)
VSTASPELDEMGPVDYLVIEFPQFRVTGEGMKELVDLVDRKIIRILDLVFVHKKEDGTVSVTALADLDGDGVLDLAVFEGASSGLLDDGDIKAAADALEPGSAGGILVYENRWAAPFARTLRRNGAQLIGGGRIPVQAILAAVEASEPARA